MLQPTKPSYDSNVFWFWLFFFFLKEVVSSTLRERDAVAVMPPLLKGTWWPGTWWQSRSAHTNRCTLHFAYVSYTFFGICKLRHRMIRNNNKQKCCYIWHVSYTHLTLPWSSLNLFHVRLPCSMLLSFIQISFSINIDHNH